MVEALLEAEAAVRYLSLPAVGGAPPSADGALFWGTLAPVLSAQIGPLGSESTCVRGVEVRLGPVGDNS